MTLATTIQVAGAGIKAKATIQVAGIKPKNGGMMPISTIMPNSSEVMPVKVGLTPPQKTLHSGNHPQIGGHIGLVPRGSWTPMDTWLASVMARIGWSSNNLPGQIAPQAIGLVVLKYGTVTTILGELFAMTIGEMWKHKSSVGLLVFIGKAPEESKEWVVDRISL